MWHQYMYSFRHQVRTSVNTPTPSPPPSPVTDMQSTERTCAAAEQIPSCSLHPQHFKMRTLASDQQGSETQG